MPTPRCWRRFPTRSSLWVSILGFLIFGEVPDIWTVIGAAFIVASGLYTAHRERVRRSQLLAAAGRAVAERLIRRVVRSAYSPCAGMPARVTIRADNKKTGGRRCALPFSGTARSSSITMPEPKPGAGQVLVRTLACGICGSDLHARKHAHRMVELARHFPGRKPMDLSRDVVFGHEFCCEVLDYGPGTRAQAEDRHAGLLAAGAADAGRAAGHRLFQRQCRRLCRAHAAQRSRCCWKCPNGLAAEHAALTEPLAVGVHAVAKANIRGGEVPLVIGCGPVGLAVIAALKIKGLHPIVAADYSPARRALAEKLGADIVVDPARSAALCDLGRACRDVAGARRPRGRRCRRCCRR